MKYLLTLFWLTSSWPMSAQIQFAQLGPYDSVLACEKAARTAEAVVKHLGAKQAESFCTSTKTDWKGTK